MKTFLGENEESESRLFLKNLSYPNRAVKGFSFFFFFFFFFLTELKLQLVNVIFIPCICFCYYG